MISQDEFIWPAPAKLNLMLHITSQRDDGYHELQTVFQFLDHGDELVFGIRDDNRIERVSGNDAVKPEDDLVIKAANRLQDLTGVDSGIDIDVRKNLPLGAGLGGGSSDAATTLHALNQLWELGLSTDELSEIGLALGADVPIFVHGFSAFAEGVGEKLSRIDLEEPWYLVITPDIHVCTREIFAASELTRDCPTIKICDLLASPWQNVCTPVVVRRHPEVAEALDVLRQFAEPKMSGTGASVFASFTHEKDAREAMKFLTSTTDSTGWSMFVAQGLNKSPLVTSLESFRRQAAG